MLLRFWSSVRRNRYYAVQYLFHHRQWKKDRTLRKWCKKIRLWSDAFATQTRVNYLIDELEKEIPQLEAQLRKDGYFE